MSNRPTRFVNDRIKREFHVTWPPHGANSVIDHSSGTKRGKCAYVDGYTVHYSKNQVAYTASTHVNSSESGTLVASFTYSANDLEKNVTIVATADKPSLAAAQVLSKLGLSTKAVFGHALFGLSGWVRGDDRSGRGNVVASMLRSYHVDKTQAQADLRAQTTALKQMVNEQNLDREEVLQYLMDELQNAKPSTDASVPEPVPPSPQTGERPRASQELIRLIELLKHKGGGRPPEKNLDKAYRRIVDFGSVYKSAQFDFDDLIQLFDDVGRPYMIKRWLQPAYNDIIINREREPTDWIYTRPEHAAKGEERADEKWTGLNKLIEDWFHNTAHEAVEQMAANLARDTAASGVQNYEIKVPYHIFHRQFVDLLAEHAVHVLELLYARAGRLGDLLQARVVVAEALGVGGERRRRGPGPVHRGGRLPRHGAGLPQLPGQGLVTRGQARDLFLVGGEVHALALGLGARLRQLDPSLLPRAPRLLELGDELAALLSRARQGALEPGALVADGAVRREQVVAVAFPDDDALLRSGGALERLLELGQQIHLQARHRSRRARRGSPRVAGRDDFPGRERHLVDRILARARRETHGPSWEGCCHVRRRSQ